MNKLQSDTKTNRLHGLDHRVRRLGEICHELTILGTKSSVSSKNENNSSNSNNDDKNNNQQQQHTEQQ
jgi:hypothetical protein